MKTLGKIFLFNFKILTAKRKELLIHLCEEAKAYMVELKESGNLVRVTSFEKKTFLAEVLKSLALQFLLVKKPITSLIKLLSILII